MPNQYNDITLQSLCKCGWPVKKWVHVGAEEKRDSSTLSREQEVYQVPKVFIREIWSMQMPLSIELCCWQWQFPRCGCTWVSPKGKGKGKHQVHIWAKYNGIWTKYKGIWAKCLGLWAKKRGWKGAPYAWCCLTAMHQMQDWQGQTDKDKALTITSSKVITRTPLVNNLCSTLPHCHHSTVML